METGSPIHPALSVPDYAELHCLSAFSFQHGASLPDELVQRARALGYRALALTDECSVAGMVRAHEAARAAGLKLLPGAEFGVTPSAGTRDVLFRFVALAHDLQGWGNLCEFITSARRAALKGKYKLRWQPQSQSQKDGQVVVGGFGGTAALAGAHDEGGLQEERLDDVGQGVDLFTHGGGDGFDAGGAAAVDVDEGFEIRPVLLVEAAGVDALQLE
jgi:DNA polymerase III alpha subunit